jgi:hypothetical protein
MDGLLVVQRWNGSKQGAVGRFASTIQSCCCCIYHSVSLAESMTD